MAINTRAYIEAYLQIKTKDAHIVPLVLNKSQCKLYKALAKQYSEGKPMRAIVLKARQMGFSTLTEAVIFKRTATARNVKSGIVTHKADATKNLYNMSKLFYERLPVEMQPARRNVSAQELVFDNQEGKGLKSSIKCMTAGGDGVGRSDTFQNLHVSEYAFWPGDKKGTLSGLLAAVPNVRDSVVIIESTANGFEDFKARWDAAVSGRSGYVAVFCGWNEMEEYRLPYDGFELTQEEERLCEAYALDLEQIAWRRWCVENNCNGDVDMLHQEYPICPEEAFLASGMCIFDQEAITARLAQLAVQKPQSGVMAYEKHGSEETGLFWMERAAFVPQRGGYITVYKPPQQGVPYVIGADTAGEGSDYFAGQVLDNMTGEQVTVLHCERMDEDVFAEQMMALGQWYNNALLAPEVNFSTHPVRVMERYGYMPLYVREAFDRQTRTWQKSNGFRTTSLSRPAILAKLVQVVRDQAHLLNDRRTLHELLTFVKNEKGHAEAMTGEHDDLVLALAIAYEARGQQEYEALPAGAQDGWNDGYSGGYGSGPDAEEQDSYDAQIDGFLEF